MGKYDLFLQRFEQLLEQQDARVQRLKSEGDFIDYKSLDKLIIGVIGGDGIGPMITKQAQRIMEFLLKKPVEEGKIEIRTIEGLTIENHTGRCVGRDQKMPCPVEGADHDAAEGRSLAEY